MRPKTEIEAMSDEARRSATGRICNWQISLQEIAAREAWFDTTGEWLEKDCYMPQYLYSLDAMHRAESIMVPCQEDRHGQPITTPQWESYCFWLANICPLGYQVRATARERNTAFLMVMLPQPAPA